MKNILDRINGRLKNAKEKLVEHENTDQKLFKIKCMEVKDLEIINTVSNWYMSSSLRCM